MPLNMNRALIFLTTCTVRGPHFPAPVHPVAPARAHCSALGGGLAADVLLKVSFGALNPRELQQWLCRLPFSAALPVQPMVWQPVPGPPRMVELRFRRKPSDAKGGTDGGLRFIIDEPVDEDGGGALLVARFSEGQYVPKTFSEKAIVTLLVRELSSLAPAVGEVGAVLRP